MTNRRRFEEFLRSMLERAEERRAEWDRGEIRLEGRGERFTGIGDPILRDSYVDAARALLDGNREHLLQVAVPILFLQRHALEVALKDAIRIVAYHYKTACHHPGPEPEAPRSHNLKRLLRCLEEWLQPAEDRAETVALLARLVERFHKLDPRGTYLRYQDSDKAVAFDLEESQRELEDTFQRLFARPRDAEAQYGWITEYEELSHELTLREYFAGEGEVA